MEKELNTQQAVELFNAFLSFDNVEECSMFLRDLCTFSELKSMIERWQVAQLVDQKQTYRNIVSQTGVSSATVTRVAHWLHHGQGGYKSVLDKMK